MWPFKKKTSNNTISSEAPKSMQATPIRESISADEYLKVREDQDSKWESKYDLSTVEGINRIPRPVSKARSNSMESPTGKLEYYLNHKAGAYEKSKQFELAEACYKKSFELMPYSSIDYNYSQYMRCPRFLRKIRKFDEARKYEAVVNKMFPDRGVFELSYSEFMNTIDRAGRSKSELELLYKKYHQDAEAKRALFVIEDDFNWCYEFLQDYSPKSYSTYCRWRDLNNEKFQVLSEQAKKLGHPLH